MFSISWSNNYDYQDYMRGPSVCPNCSCERLMTVRVYTQKTKLYGLVNVKTKRFVTGICHTCLKEFPVSQQDEKRVLAQFMTDISVKN